MRSSPEYYVIRLGRATRHGFDGIAHHSRARGHAPEIGSLVMRCTRKNHGKSVHDILTFLPSVPKI